ncbi:MAG: hypothetical protein P8X68_18925 [Desulfobacterales bacterium]
MAPDKISGQKGSQGHEQSAEKEREGYTFCDGCNEVPFCGIKFYQKGNVVTRIEPWHDYPHSPICSKEFACIIRVFNQIRLNFPMNSTLH